MKLSRTERSDVEIGTLALSGRSTVCACSDVDSTIELAELGRSGIFRAPLRWNRLITKGIPLSSRPQGRKDSFEVRSSALGSQSSVEDNEDVPADSNDNEKADITRKQQVKIWLACALSSFWFVGIIQSFGLFQAHYSSNAAVKEGIIRPQDQTKRAAIGAIGSLGGPGIVGTFAMLFFPRLPRIGRHIRTLCFAGTVLMAGGFAAAAACTNLWMLLLTQGLLVGIGGGVFLNALSTILPEYFHRRSGLAQGASFAVGSIGGAVLSLTLPRLLKSVGSRRTLGILSITSLFILGTSSCLAQPPRKCRDRSIELAGWKAFKNPIFVLLFVVNLVHPFTLAIPMTFGPVFSRSLGFSVEKAAMVLAISSLVGAPSRLVMGLAADYIGHNNMLFLATSVFGLGTFLLWLPAAKTGNAGLWITFKVVYGMLCGVFITVINSVQKRHFGDELYYPYNGALTSIRGVGYVIGVPIAGSLIARGKGAEVQGCDFVRAITFTGMLLVVSASCLAGVRWIDARRNKWRWIK